MSGTFSAIAHLVDRGRWRWLCDSIGLWQHHRRDARWVGIQQAPDAQSIASHAQFSRALLDVARRGSRLRKGPWSLPIWRVLGDERAEILYMLKTIDAQGRNAKHKQLKESFKGENTLLNFFKGENPTEIFDERDFCGCHYLSGFIDAFKSGLCGKGGSITNGKRAIWDVRISSIHLDLITPRI